MTADPEQKPWMKVAYCVRCVDMDGTETTHIFSTPERRQRFIDNDHRGHVSYDYFVDEPTHHEERHID